MKKAGKFDIVAFCDIIEEKAVNASKEYGTPDAKVYTDYKKLLEDKTIDVVYVLTPNKSHSFISIDALESGKHVLCEKPMAKTAKEAKDMVDTAKRTGKLLTIGYNNRYNPSCLYIKEAADRGDFGEIYFARAHALRRRAVPTWGVFLNEEEQGGGPLIDIGTHALDMTLWFMNNYKPKSVLGSVYHKLNARGDSGNIFGPWDPEKFTVEDSAFAMITMEDGSSIHLESAWALNTVDISEATTTLHGTLAGADMKQGQNSLRINGDEFGRTYEKTADFAQGGVAFYQGNTNSPEFIEQRVFYDAILKGTPLTILPEQAYVVTQILEAIYESSKQGKAIQF